MSKDLQRSPMDRHLLYDKSAISFFQTCSVTQGETSSGKRLKLKGLVGYSSATLILLSQLHCISIFLPQVKPPRKKTWRDRNNLST